jgi:hypothetical protein
MSGKPYTFRLLSEWSKPKFTRIGVDVAGAVEVVGKNVTARGKVVISLPPAV